MSDKELGDIKEIVLLKDIVIPVGTIFKNVDGGAVKHVEGNFEHIFGLTKDSYGSIVYSVESMQDSKKWFAEVVR